MKVLDVLISVAAVVIVTEGSQKLPAFRVSNDDLYNLIGTLHRIDVNRPQPNQLKVRWQGHTTSHANDDHAHRSLFERVDESLLEKPTYRTLIALFDNYDKYVGQREHVTNHERSEEDAFLDEVFKTRVMQETYSFLHRKRHPYARSKSEFRAWVKQLWFDAYSRARGEPDTSGFEHVFVGEVNQNEVAGLHNWVRFYTLERNRSANVDYKGFIIKRYEIMGSLRFAWENNPKRSGSFFLRTSPEFELAVNTLCMLARPSQGSSGPGCKFDLDGCSFKLISHPHYQRNKVHVGTVFPYADGTCRLNNRTHGNHN